MSRGASARRRSTAIDVVANPKSRVALMDRLEAMEMFVRIVETGSFSVVAREMGKTQPTISKQVTALEQRLKNPAAESLDAQHQFDRARHCVLRALQSNHR